MAGRGRHLMLWHFYNRFPVRFFKFLYLRNVGLLISKLILHFIVCIQQFIDQILFYTFWYVVLRVFKTLDMILKTFSHVPALVFFPKSCFDCPDGNTYYLGLGWKCLQICGSRLGFVHNMIVTELCLQRCCLCTAFIWAAGVDANVFLWP